MRKVMIFSVKVFFGFVFCWLSLAAQAALIDFSVSPVSGNVVGVPGATVGWGYSITNNSPDYYVVPTAINADLFQHGLPLAIFDFPVIANLPTM